MKGRERGSRTKGKKKRWGGRGCAVYLGGHLRRQGVSPRKREGKDGRGWPIILLPAVAAIRRALRPFSDHESLVDARVRAQRKHGRFEVVLSATLICHERWNVYTRGMIIMFLKDGAWAGSGPQEPVLYGGTEYVYCKSRGTCIPRLYFCLIFPLKETPCPESWVVTLHT